MRVLLDECVPKRLRLDLPGHSVKTVVEMGWSGVKNGDLLGLAAADFDCFLTVDRNLQFQQNVAGLPLAVVVLRAVDNKFPTLRRLMPKAILALQEIKPGELIEVAA
jgi:predicted nuclease of predicted toxin-antitoxin system